MLRLAPVVTALAILFASTANSGGPDKDVQEAIDKLADALKKGDAKAIPQLAAKAAALPQLGSVADLCRLYMPRGKGGLGWGVTPGANPATDGIAKKIGQFAKEVKPADAADPANGDAAYRILAITEILRRQGPPGGKNAQAMNGLINKFDVAATGFAKALLAKNAPAIKTTADNLSISCVACHANFK